jgi:dTDP-4-dehydrorhamnose reductase
MKIVLTGAGGTLGKAMRAHLVGKGHEVLVWDRRLCPPSQPSIYVPWLTSVSPDAIIHAAIASTPTAHPNEDYLVSVEWTQHLARHAGILGARFVFVSSVMVFCGPGENGPFKTNQYPRSPHPYGALKLQAENMLQEYAEHTTIARLGWQIAPFNEGNHMVAHLQQQHSLSGSLSANRRWIPACSFVNATAETIEQLLRKPPGVYHIDSNAGWNFFEICCALSADLSKNWSVTPISDAPFDQRLIDTVVSCAPLSQQLPSLGALP